MKEECGERERERNVLSVSVGGPDQNMQDRGGKDMRDKRERER